MKGRLRLLAPALVWLAAAAACESPARRPQWNRGGELDAVRERLRPVSAGAHRPGVAAAVLFDTSGSMDDRVRAAGGGLKPKIEIARAAALHIVERFTDFARRHPEQPVLVGVYEFSGRPGRPWCRRVVELGPPDAAAAVKALAGLKADGSTPIGDAMILAKQDLDASGMERRHILVVSDGENNRGFTPGDVTRVIGELPEEERAAVYFVAFDVEAEVFQAVKDAGALVLAADDEAELRRALDYILTGRILVELPPAGKP